MLRENETIKKIQIFIRFELQFLKISSSAHRFLKSKQFFNKMCNSNVNSLTFYQRRLKYKFHRMWKRQFALSHSEFRCAFLWCWAILFVPTCKNVWYIIVCFGLEADLTIPIVLRYACYHQRWCYVHFVYSFIVYLEHRSIWLFIIKYLKVKLIKIFVGISLAYQIIHQILFVAA